MYKIKCCFLHFYFINEIVLIYLSHHAYIEKSKSNFVELRIKTLKMSLEI